MRCHDYHLSKYEVSDRGETIVLHLVYGYPEQETDYSRITFSHVALYNFIHTSNAIITDIDEVSLLELAADFGAEIQEWRRMYAVRFFENDLQSYITYLQSNNYKTWYIESAIGLSGFVIAKEVSNA